MQYIPRQLTISIPEDERGCIAEILVEVYEGQLVAYVWGEHSIGDDPDARVVLLEDASDRSWKRV